MAAHSSMFLASHTVHVTTEANTRPTMTACTSMSADMNIDQGDRSRGSWTLPIDRQRVARRRSVAGAPVPRLQRAAEQG